MTDEKTKTETEREAPFPQPMTAEEAASERSAAPPPPTSNPESPHGRPHGARGVRDGDALRWSHTNEQEADRKLSEELARGLFPPPHAPKGR